MIYKRKCKVCKTSFTPRYSNEIVCSKHCEIEFNTSKALKNLSKIKSEEKKVLSQEKKAWNQKKKEYRLSDISFWKELCKTTCHTYIRFRDKDKGCISCGKPLRDKNTDAGHLWTSGEHSNIRYHEFNINGQCSRPCNKDKAGDTNNYRINFVKRYSQELLDEIDGMAKKTRRYEIDDYKEIVEYYKKKIEELKKNI